MMYCASEGGAELLCGAVRVGAMARWWGAARAPEGCTTSLSMPCCLTPQVHLLHPLLEPARLRRAGAPSAQVPRRPGGHQRLPGRADRQRATHEAGGGRGGAAEQVSTCTSCCRSAASGAPPSPPPCSRANTQLSEPSPLRFHQPCSELRRSGAYKPHHAASSLLQGLHQVVGPLAAALPSRHAHAHSCRTELPMPSPTSLLQGLHAAIGPWSAAIPCSQSGRSGAQALRLSQSTAMLLPAGTTPSYLTPRCCVSWWTCAARTPPTSSCAMT